MTRKQINLIRETTPNELKGHQISRTDCKRLETVGRCQKSSANWSDIVELVEYNGNKILVVTRFGEVI